MIQPRSVLPKQTLSNLEARMASLVWEGLTNRAIAETVGTTEQVVKNYLNVIFTKLGVWTRLELAMYIAANGGAEWSLTHRMPSETDRRAAIASAQTAPIWR